MKSFFLKVGKGTAASDIAALVLRIGFGVLMIPKHGYAKLVEFSARKDDFMSFLGLGGTISLGLTVFAEFFCSIFLIFGLFTRLATVPLLITMFVILSVHDWQLFGKYELATALLVGYAAIFALGPGKYSLDYLLLKK